MSYKKLNPRQLKFVRWLMSSIGFSTVTYGRLKRVLSSGEYDTESDGKIFNSLGTLHGNKYIKSLKQ